MSQQPLTDLNLQPLLSPRETAAILGVTCNTLAVWRSRKRYPLPHVKVGGRVMYRPEDVQAFIETRLHNGQDNDQSAVSSHQAGQGQQLDLFDHSVADPDDASKGQ